VTISDPELDLIDCNKLLFSDLSYELILFSF